MTSRQNGHRSARRFLSKENRLEAVGDTNACRNRIQVQRADLTQSTNRDIGIHLDVLDVDVQTKILGEHVVEAHLTGQAPAIALDRSHPTQDVAGVVEKCAVQAGTDIRLESTQFGKVALQQ